MLLLITLLIVSLRLRATTPIPNPKRAANFLPWREIRRILPIIAKQINVWKSKKKIISDEL